MDATLVALDTETTGRYPIESEICELAAVKWSKGQVVDTFQTLIRPSSLMSQEIIAIHNITNEMVASAPVMHTKIKDFYDFLSGSVLIAHHAPFDLGFLAWEFEKAQLNFPEEPVFCSSLMSRKAIPESPNHRLQTLIPFLNIKQGRAHRALDDAQACLEVALKCFERINPRGTLNDILDYQPKSLYWQDFSIEDLRKSETYGELVGAILRGHHAEVRYAKGSRPGQPRVIVPLGIVRNPDGDYVAARDENQGQVKRFYLERILSAKEII